MVLYLPETDLRYLRYLRMLRHNVNAVRRPQDETRTRAHRGGSCRRSPRRAERFRRRSGRPDAAWRRSGRDVDFGVRDHDRSSAGPSCRRRPHRSRRCEAPVSASITAPSGWYLIRREGVGSGTSTALSQVLYYHVAGLLEPSSYTWQFQRKTGAAGAVLAYGGVDVAAPIADHAGRVQSDATSIVAPSVTTTQPGDGLLGSSGRRHQPDHTTIRNDRAA